MLERIEDKMTFEEEESVSEVRSSRRRMVCFMCV